MGLEKELDADPQLKGRLTQWQEEGRPPIKVGVNLFAAQLRYGNLINKLRDSVVKYKIPPHLIELEITETIAGQEDESILNIFKQIRDLGFGLALDDFGTGYASLHTLKYVPATTVKIDKSFLQDLLVLKEDAAIISAIMHVSRSLSLRVIAEGIEAKEQEVFLRVMGCHLGQGHLYGRAVEGDEFHPARSSTHRRSRM